MKKNWFQLVSLTLNVVLLAAVVCLYGAVKDLRAETESSIHTLENSVERRISDIAGSIRASAAEAARIHSSYSLEPTGLDKKTKTLQADFTVELKEWSGDTAVTVLIGQNGTEREVPAVHSGGGRFSAPVSLATENGTLWLSLTVTTAGVTKREELGGWEDVSMLLPLRLDGWSWGEPQLLGGIFKISTPSATVMDHEGNPAAAQTAEFRLYLNGTLAQTAAAQLSEDEEYRYACEAISAEGVAQGDQLELFFACRDAYGLHYEFPLFAWEAEQTSDRTGTSGGSSSNIPILTWN